VLIETLDKRISIFVKFIFLVASWISRGSLLSCYTGSYNFVPRFRKYCCFRIVKETYCTTGCEELEDHQLKKLATKHPSNLFYLDMFSFQIYHKYRHIFVELFEKDTDTSHGPGDHYFYPIDLSVKVPHFTWSISQYTTEIMKTLTYYCIPCYLFSRCP
jgi:hypothetical protein